MKPLLVALLLAVAPAALAQDRLAELDAAVAEARAAYNALQAAIARRDRGVEAEPGERTIMAPKEAEEDRAAAAGRPRSSNCTGTVTGRCNRVNEAYLARVAQLEGEVELAQRRYDAAMKRWNYLK
jgi:hypothetical protein